MSIIILSSAGHGTYNTILPLKHWGTKEILAKLSFFPILANFGAKKLLQNVKILPHNYHFQMDWNVNFEIWHNSYQNSKIYFLTLSSHFEKFWSIVNWVTGIYIKLTAPSQATCMERSSDSFRATSVESIA